MKDYNIRRTNNKNVRRNVISKRKPMDTKLDKKNRKVNKKQIKIDMDINFTDEESEEIKKIDLALKKIVRRINKCNAEIKTAMRNPDDVFRIAVAGRFNTGKSSLVNALVGMEVLPTKAITATTVCTKILYGENFSCSIIDNGYEKKVSEQEAQGFVLNHQAKKGIKAEAVFCLNLPWLADKTEITDTPGMGDSSQQGMLTDEAKKAAASADMAVLVYDASSFISSREEAFAKEMSYRLGGNVLYVVNCINRLNSPEEEESVRRLAKEKFSSESYPEGMGLIFMVLSSPGNIDLNGLDTHIKSICSRSEAAENRRTEIKKISRAARLAADKKSFDMDLSVLQHELLCQREKICAIHSAIHEKAIHQKEIEAESIADDMAKLEYSLKDKFLSGELRTIIEKAMDSECFKSDLKSRLISHFSGKVKRMKIKEIQLDDYISLDFIKNIINSLDFPYFDKSDAKSNGNADLQRAGYVASGIGAAIATFLVPNPITAALTVGVCRGGNSVFRSIDESSLKKHKEKELPEQIAFVNSNLKPQLGSAFCSEFKNAVKNIKKNKLEEAEKYETGLESYISKISRLEDKIKKMMSDLAKPI